MLNWPQLPYKGLAYYGPEDLPLFAGRDADVEACAGLLAAPNTRLLLLHGRTGCGKSSFLRAGLIPTIESRAYGFEFLRRMKNGVQTPVFVRSTGAPLTRIAMEIFRFVSSKHLTRTALGDVEIDLSDAALGCETVGDFIKTAQSPPLLIDSLRKISEKLPNSLILVLDQAEEVITLTQPNDADRNNFFLFLKLFNAFLLDVKLVIALRTEYFGIFFDLMGLDASVKTDINQFRLEELDERGVREAILRPTSGEKRINGLTAFDKYQFRYKPDAVDMIVKDLFSATQSGGMLPALQILCRDLYNEIQKRGKPSEIDIPLYTDGGGLTGRVDKHIRVSLRDAITQATSDPRGINMDAEERRWRKALCSLVKLEADGTARTDLTESRTILDALDDQQNRYNYKKVLDYISQPDVLIVRDFSVFNPRTGRNETRYSLGHDAVALALYYWEVEEKQAEEKRRAVVTFRRRSVILVVIALLSAVSVATAVYTTYPYVSSVLQLGQALNLAADRVYVQNPNLAITSALQANAVLNKPFVKVFAGTDESSTKRLADMISALPSKVVPRDAAGESLDSAENSQILSVPSAHGFVVCCADSQIKFIDANDFSVKSKLKLETDIKNPWIYGVDYVDKEKTYLLLVGDESESDRSSEWIRRSSVIVTDLFSAKFLKRKKFVEKSKLFSDSEFNQAVGIQLLPFGIALRDFSKSGANSELFVLDSGWRKTKVDSFVFERIEKEENIDDLLSEEYLVRTRGSKTGAVLRPELIKLRDRSEKNMLTNNNPMFNDIVLRSKSARCFSTSNQENKSERLECNTRVLAGGPYFMIESLLISDFLDRDQVKIGEQRDESWFTIVDARTGEYFDVFQSDLRVQDVFGNDGSPQISEVTVDETGIFVIATVFGPPRTRGAAGGTARAFTAKRPGDRDSKTIKPEYIGAMQNLNILGSRYGHIRDSEAVIGTVYGLSGARNMGELWELGEAFHKRRDKLSSLSAHELAEEACKAGLRSVRPEDWQTEIGIGSPPAYPCRQKTQPNAAPSKPDEEQPQ
jgi:hypothetical protein